MRGAAWSVSVDVHALSASVGREVEHLKVHHRADVIEKGEDF